MRLLSLFVATLAITGALAAQSDEGSSEDMIELSPFEVSNTSESNYRASASQWLSRTPSAVIDPKSSLSTANAAISVLKRADAVAIQFVLSHAGDKQETRNQELYASLGLVETALKKVPGVRVEQREVRFTGGDRKLFSLSRGGSAASFVSILVLADLPADARVADRVKQIRDALAATKLVGQTKYADGSVGLYLRNPDQYRREILQKIFEDVDFMKKGFGPEFEILPSGLTGKVHVRIAAEAELELWIDYSFTFRSIRELTAPKKA